MAEVSLEGLIKHFDRTEAVRSLDLRVADWEFLVLVGPSGCGKTTVLRLIAGLETPTAGRIFIGGQSVENLPARKRDIAMVFQNYALYPHMNVYRNMAFGLEQRGAPEAETRRRVHEAARMLGIAECLDRKPRQLSGGQRQRVALGRAIVRKPSVFLFDEPLSNLDAKLRVKMRGELVKLHRRLEATIVYVTHDQVEAMTMGQRIAVMNEGRLLQVGTPREVYHRPANLFVAGFIGSPSMNFLNASLETAGEGVTLRVDRSEITLPDDGRPWADTTPGSVVLGVRPEDVQVLPVSPKASGGGALSGKIEVVEHLGAETYLELNAGKHQITARVNASQVWEIGQQVTLQMDPASIRLFDPKTEEALPGRHLHEAPMAAGPRQETGT